MPGEFFGSEEYGFYLYPVFAEGEGEPVYALGMLTVHRFIAAVPYTTPHFHCASS